MRLQLKHWPGKYVNIQIYNLYKAFLKHPQNHIIVGYLQASNVIVDIRDNPTEIIPSIIKAKVINLGNLILNKLEKLSKKSIW